MIIFVQARTFTYKSKQCIPDSFNVSARFLFKFSCQTRKLHPWKIRLFIGNDKKKETGESVRTNKLKMKKNNVFFYSFKNLHSRTTRTKASFFEQNEEIKH